MSALVLYSRIYSKPKKNIHSVNQRLPANLGVTKINTNELVQPALRKICFGRLARMGCFVRCLYIPHAQAQTGSKSMNSEQKRWFWNGIFNPIQFEYDSGFNHILTMVITATYHTSWGDERTLAGTLAGTTVPKHPPTSQKPVDFHQNYDTFDDTYVAFHHKKPFSFVPNNVGHYVTVIYCTTVVFMGFLQKHSRLTSVFPTLKDLRWAVFTIPLFHSTGWLRTGFPVLGLL